MLPNITLPLKETGLIAMKFPANQFISLSRPSLCKPSFGKKPLGYGLLVQAHLQSFII